MDGTAQASTETSGPWPRESVGRLASTSFPLAFVDETVAALRERIRAQPFACLDLVVVQDRHGKFAGAVALADIVRADADAPVGTVLRGDSPRILPNDDQEQAGLLATASGVSALPVVEADGRIVGIVPAVTIMQVMAGEHHEDLHRLAGIMHESSEASHALDAPPFRQVLKRLPWLAVGLALSAAAAFVMAGFEDALRTNLSIAFFIPSLVYLADAIGTQTETIAVRGLSFRRRPLGSLLKNEVLTGAMAGLALGAAASIAVWVALGSVPLAAGVGISLVAAGSVACAIGLLLPWSLSAIGIDPAFGSGPVATIIQDVLTIGLYFVTMSLLVG